MARLLGPLKPKESQGSADGIKKACRVQCASVSLGSFNCFMLQHVFWFVVLVCLGSFNFFVLQHVFFVLSVGSRTCGLVCACACVGALLCACVVAAAVCLSFCLSLGLFVVA